MSLSHSCNGFVKYRIKPLSSLQLDEVINNTAAIYFDYNEAVMTNTVSTKITNTTDDKDETLNSSINVYPNPSTNGTVLQLKGVEPGRYHCKLISSSSAIVLDQELVKSSNDDFSLVTGRLSSGNYLLQLTDVRNNYLIKFVVKD